jgi:hypothetical protein
MIKLSDVRVHLQYRWRCDSGSWCFTSHDFAAATVGLRAWETRGNHERFSLALQGRTPAEKLASLLPAPAA